MAQRSVIVLTALVLLTVAVYAPLRSAPFVYEDDHYVSMAALRAPIGWRVPGRPLLTASMRLTPDPATAHLVNVGLHIGNGIAVYALGVTLVGETAGLAAAGLFLLHPATSEAVAYVSGRGELLVTLFALLSAICALRWQPGRWGLAVGAVLSLILASLSKDTGLVAVPLVWLTVWLWHGWIPEREGLRAVLYAAVGVALGLGLTRILGWADPDLRWPDFLLYQTAAIVRVLALGLWPVGQSIEHDPIAWSPLALGAAVIGAGALLSALAVAAARGARLGVWAGLWVLVVLAPRLLFPQPGEFVHEYHLYPAFLGIALLAGAGIAYWLDGRHYTLARSRAAFLRTVA
jgi:hypothetical protein